MTRASRQGGAPRPPAIARWVVRLCAPSDVRDGVLGDLEEGFERLAESRRGSHAARRWYWKQAIGSARFLYQYPRRLRRTPSTAVASGHGGASVFGLLLELRLAVRALARRPVYAVLVTGTLALGIGANAAIFSFVNAILFRPLPFPNPDQLVTLQERHIEQGNVAGVAPPTFVDWKDQSRAFSDLAVFVSDAFVLSGGPAPEQMSGASASPNIFRLLGTRLRNGQGFAPDAEYEAGERVVVTSAGFARRWFGEDEDPLSRTLILNDEQFRVVGVLPDDFRFLLQPDLWVPIHFDSGALSEGMRGARYMSVVGRLASDVTLAAATEDMSLLARSLGEVHPNNRGWDVTLTGLHDFATTDVRRPMLIILVAVIFVLLVAIGNTTNLILTRSTEARRDWAVRKALGASTWQLLRASLAEHLLLAASGGTLAVILTTWALPPIVGMAPTGMPRLEDVRVDLPVIAYVTIISLAVGLVMSAMPWISGAVHGSFESLAGRNSVSAAPRNRLRHTLIAGEVAISVVLVIGAGLLTRSFWELRNVDPGFDPDGLSVVRMSLPRERYQTTVQLNTFTEELTARLAAIPGVNAVSSTNNLPFSGSRFAFGFYPDDATLATGGPQPSAEFHAVGPGYFRAMGIPLRSGRTIAKPDGDGSTPVVVINDAIARTYWPDTDPVGERLTVISQTGPVSREIIGVVGSVKHGGPSSDWIPEVYVPFAQDAWSFMTIVLRTDGTDLTAAARAIVASVDPTLPAPSVQPMTEIAAQWFAPLRFQTVLAGAFAVFALSLACVGLYGVISYIVHLRTAEIGIRMALGAQRGDVFRSVVGTGVIVTGIGLVVGIVAAMMITRGLESLLFEIVPADPLTYTSVSVLVLGVALVASALPARRATKIDPVVALKEL